MTTHVSGQPVAAATAPALYLSALRRNLLAVVVGNPLFSDAEQLRTNDSAYQCQDVKKLALWLKNVRRVAADRDHAEGLRLMAEGIARFEAKLAGATAPAKPTAEQLTTASAWATPAQCEEVFALALHPTLTACEKSQALRKLPYLTEQSAVGYIGKLWGKVLHRTGQRSFSDGSTCFAA